MDTESDIEVFEDNPEEYVSRDIEGSDVDTRRRAACDLVRTLALNYEDKMMSIFGQYVEVLVIFWELVGDPCFKEYVYLHIK